MVDVKLEDILETTKSSFSAISTKQAKLEEDIKNLHALQDSLNGVGKRMDEIETKMNRPPIAASVAPSISPEVKAFNKFVRKGTVGPEEAKLLSTDDSTTGGYLVPTVLRNQIIELIVKISPVRQYANVATIGGNALEIPKEAAGSVGASWITERGTRAETTTSTFGMIRIPMHEMYADPRVTQTMLDDAAFDVEGWVVRKVAERMAKLESTAFISGTGVGQPAGITLDADIPTFTTAGSNVISMDDIFDMYYNFESAYLNGAVWMMNRKVVGYLRKLKAVANGNYLIPPTTGAAGEVPMTTLLGKPIVEMPDMYALETDGTPADGSFPIILANLNAGYQIVEKNTIGLMRDPYTNKPFVEFYATKRVGGQVIQPSAFLKMVTKN